VNPLEELDSLEVLSPFAATKQGIVGRLFDGYDPVRLDAGYLSFRAGRGKMAYSGGKHLCMSVDVTALKEELLGEMERVLKYYQGMLPKKSTRRKPTAVVNIWDVYDQYRDGTPKNTIAKKLASSYAHDSAHVAAAYQAVIRAIEKADRLIKAWERNLPVP
jgi:hypothetical protein